MPLFSPHGMIWIVRNDLIPSSLSLPVPLTGVNKIIHCADQCLCLGGQRVIQ